MKHEITTAKPAFQPVSITLTFESQAELDAFGATFNCGPISNALDAVYPSIQACTWWKIFQDAGADVDTSKLRADLKQRAKSF